MSYPKQRVLLIPPTAPDLLSVVSQNAIANLRAGVSGSLELPSLRARAKAVVTEAPFLGVIDLYR